MNTFIVKTYGNTDRERRYVPLPREIETEETRELAKITELPYENRHGERKVVQTRGYRLRTHQEMKEIVMDYTGDEKKWDVYKTDKNGNRVIIARTVGEWKDLNPIHRILRAGTDKLWKILGTEINLPTKKGVRK